jgi:hypothetical protein
VKIAHYSDYWYAVPQTEMRRGDVVVEASEDDYE